MNNPNSRHMEYPKESPWKRGRAEIVVPPGGYIKIRKNHISEAFDDNKYVNMDIDIDTKLAVLNVSASVVSLVSSTNGNAKFIASGTIIDSCKEHNGIYLNTILTSACLLGSSTDDTKVQVYLFDGRVFDGRVYAHDLHYNLAVINIESDAQLPSATLRLLDDSISIDPRRIRRHGDKFKINPHSELFDLYPGVMVVAIGRHHKESYLMAAPGKFSLDSCQFDCKELMITTCRISKCGIGGPLVNCYGEVIGVNFYDELRTPFLPINIISKCLEHFKKHGRFCRPRLGMEVTNLYAAHVNKLETIIQNFPIIFKGIIVEKVIPGSPADCAGIRRDDVIVQCDNNFVMGFLEFFEKICDKTGESVEVAVIRKGSDAFLNLTMAVDETSRENFNSWPLPQESYLHVQRVRGQG